MEGIANIFALSCLGIFLSMIFALIRATKGPTVFDRILAVNNFGTLTVLFIGVLGYLTSRPDFLDIALVYALMNFIGTLAVLRYSDFSSHLEQEDYDSSSTESSVSSSTEVSSEEQTLEGGT